MTDLPLPTSGGSYIRRPDGALERSEPSQAVPVPEPETPADHVDDQPMNEA